MNAKILAAALGLLVAGGAVADASAATVVKTTRTTVAHRVLAPAGARKTVTVIRRAHRPHLVRLLPAHRLAPRVHLARAFATKRVVKTTVIR